MDQKTADPIIAQSVIEPDTTTPHPGPFGADGRPISAFRQWYMVVSLTILMMVAFVDQATISLLVDPIKADLHLNDTQMSLLLGLSLLLFNALVTFPIGWMIDRFNRKRLIGIGAVLWTIATVCTGLAHNFVQLFAGRAGVGFSQGGLLPIAFSLIRDGVSKDRRGRAFAINAGGLFMGGALALFVSAAVLKVAAAHGPFILPILGLVKPWQMVFFVVGLGGLPFTLLLAPMTEPLREAAGVEQAGGYGAAFAYIGQRWRQYVPLMTFNCLFFITTGAYAMWSPTLAHRNYNVSLPQVGAMMGLIVGAAPAIGLFTFGAIVDKLTKRGVKNGPAMVALGVVFLVAVPAVVTPLMPSLTAFWISYTCLMLVSSGIGPAVSVMNSHLTPSRNAGKIFAVFNLTQTLIGFSVGPLVAGLFSDHLFTGRLALAHAITLTAVLFLGLTMIAGWWLLFEMKRYVEADVTVPVGAVA